MHCHQSFFDQKGASLFYDPDNEYRLSPLAFGLIAGQLHHARGMSAILSPTVNSYKRLVPGYEAPVYIGWAQINRSALIRIPRITKGNTKAIRAELRCPDPSANPYLAFTVMLATALDGIDRNLPVPNPLNQVNIYNLTQEELKKHKIRQLPGSLLEALEELEKDEVIKNALGPVIYKTFRRARLEEWENYRIRVTDWEIDNYLETA
jgi:glutamine synthetase